MEKYFNVLRKVELFSGIEPSELDRLLLCMSAKTVSCKKGEAVLELGQALRHLGIVLGGEVQVIKEDYYGNRNILAHFREGELFGESFACAQTNSLPVSVIAAANSEILFIEVARLTNPCPTACGFHVALIQNLLCVVARKNIVLTQKMEITSKRTTREKLLAYLSAQAQAAGSSHFFIPFNRQELADYLGVERSAMSAELSKMRGEGILKTRKNEFELL
jgi:CRP-like cAMP-binding protein